MGKTTSVLLITGFLGSGKTTFLNRIINNFPKELKLTILMNEFGEIGVDGTLVEGDDIDIIEISRGSIFCVCVKTDFIKGLYALNATIKPDLLIIESTGVANPSDLKRDLALPIFDNRFQFTEQFCIIDALHFLEAFEVFASIEKQLSTSTVFIINKTDLTTRESIEKIKEVVRNNHPEPLFFETTYSRIPFDSWPFLNIKNDSQKNRATDSLSEPLSTAELDKFISSILENPELESFPPDQLASVTLTWHGDTLDQISKMAKSLPAAIIRAKGFVQENGVIYLFNYVMGEWTIEITAKTQEDIQHMNKIVFIGNFAAIEDIGKIITYPNWSAGKILQPFDHISKIS